MDYTPKSLGVVNPWQFEIIDEKQIRWDNYFMNMSKMVSTQSKCLSRKIGSIAVRDKTILATGYNGPARGVPHCEHRNNPLRYECPRKVLGYKSGEGLDLCLAVHSEQSLLAQAAREGISLKGSSIYIYASVFPCTVCTGLMINAGVTEIVVPNYAEPYDELALYQLDNCDKIKLRKMTFIDHETT